MTQPNWYLEGVEGQSRRIVRTQVRTLPFSVGRRPSSDLVLNSKMVSQQHAQLLVRGGRLWVHDLGSTNGTFVNGKQITGEEQLRGGDILHFADLEFTLVEDDAEPSWLPATQTVNLKDAMTPGGPVARYRELREMLTLGNVQAMFQPLVKLSDRSVLGHEVLGRGIIDDEVASPGELFMTAETIGLAEVLSVTFRAKGMDEARRLAQRYKVFLNTHPAELQKKKPLLDSLSELRGRHPEREIVLEIHESAVANAADLKGFHKELEKLRIGVAFDDFGTGQARLVELTDAAPDYLKFDIAFIRNIHQAPKKRREMVRALVRMATDMGIVTIAEGIECEEECQTCLDMGFEYAQGYLLGRPGPVEDFLE